MEDFTVLHLATVLASCNTKGVVQMHQQLSLFSLLPSPLLPTPQIDPYWDVIEHPEDKPENYGVRGQVSNNTNSISKAMIKLILSVKDYLIIYIGGLFIVPQSSLYLCRWVKSEYPALTATEVLIVSRYLIRSAAAISQLHPDEKTYLDRAVSSLLASRN